MKMEHEEKAFNCEAQNVKDVICEFWKRHFVVHHDVNYTGHTEEGEHCRMLLVSNESKRAMSHASDDFSSQANAREKEFHEAFDLMTG